MFGVIWMACLTGLSGPFQGEEDANVTLSCLQGLQLAIHVACAFDMSLERNAFVQTMSNFTSLSSTSGMQHKNIQAIKSILITASNERDILKDSWKPILGCVSELERLQLLAKGVDQGLVPNLSFRAQFVDSQGD